MSILPKSAWFIFDKMIFTMLGMATPCPYHNCSSRGMALPCPDVTKSVKMKYPLLNHVVILKVKNIVTIQVSFRIPEGVRNLVFASVKISPRFARRNDN